MERKRFRGRPVGRYFVRLEREWFAKHDEQCAPLTPIQILTYFRVLSHRYFQFTYGILDYKDCALAKEGIALAELEALNDVGLIVWDQKIEVIYIPGFLNMYPIGGDQIKGLDRDVFDLPPSPIWGVVANDMMAHNSMNPIVEKLRAHARGQHARRALPPTPQARVTPPPVIVAPPDTPEQPEPEYANGNELYPELLPPKPEDGPDRFSVFRQLKTRTQVMHYIGHAISNGREIDLEGITGFAQLSPEEIERFRALKPVK